MHHRVSPIRPRPAFAGLWLAGLLLPVIALAQQPVQQTERSPAFKPIGLYQLQLDGAIDESARIYHSAGLGTILVRSEQLSSYLELVPRGKSVNSFSPDSFFENADGSVDKLPNVQTIERGSFSLNGDLPSFTAEGRSVAFVKKPPLLGPQKRAELIDHDPTYGQRAKAHTPVEQYLTMLRNVDDDVEIKVFFGSWCSVCAEFVPHILSAEDALAESKVRFSYHGLPQNFDDAEANRLGVTSVPTGIIYRNGEEVGRASGYSWRFPTMSIVNALTGQARPEGR